MEWMVRHCVLKPRQRKRTFLFPKRAQTGADARLAYYTDCTRSPLLIGKAAKT